MGDFGVLRRDMQAAGGGTLRPPARTRRPLAVEPAHTAAATSGSPSKRRQIGPRSATPSWIRGTGRAFCTSTTDAILPSCSTCSAVVVANKCMRQARMPVPPVCWLCKRPVHEDGGRLSPQSPHVGSPEHVLSVTVCPGQLSIMRRESVLASFSQDSHTAGRDFVYHPCLVSPAIRSPARCRHWPGSAPGQTVRRSPRSRTIRSESS